MKFFIKEKIRMKEYYQVLLMAFFLFVYFMNQMAQVTSNDILAKKGEPQFPIVFLDFWMIGGVFCLISYLNLHLFWIKEQGKRVFILRKYDTIPLSKSEIYSAKMRLIIRYVLLYWIWTIIIHAGTQALVLYVSIDPLKSVLDISFLFGFSILLLGIYFIIIRFYDMKTMKEM